MLEMRQPPWSRISKNKYPFNITNGEMDTEKLIGLDWVVIGAETGTRKKVSDFIIQSAKWIVCWCGNNNVPCFVKDNMRQADPDCVWPREFPK